VAKLKSLTSFVLVGGTVDNFSPLSNLTKLTNLEIRGNDVENGMMAPDLKWMSKLTSLTGLIIGASNELRNLVSLEGIPSLPKLTAATFSSASPEDLAPLLALSGLKKLDLTDSEIADLTPLSGLLKLEELNLFGVTVEDFSPLAECPALKILNVYSTNESDYSTLGKLTQVQSLQSGMTALDDISWIPEMTGLKKLQVFSERIKDYTPLAKTQLEDLEIWKMKVPADLNQISDVVSLKKLKLWSLKVAGGFEGLASLVNLEELILNDMNAKDGTAVDMDFVKSLANLKILELKNSELSNFDTVANCVKLEKVEIGKTTGIDNLEALKKLPNLIMLQVPKGVFSEEQLTGYANPKIKITQR